MACIYKIYLCDPEKFYIGSTKNFKSRKYQHSYSLKYNKHANVHLQRSYNKCGHLKFCILEECFEDNLAEREQYYIDFLKPHYNICPVAYSSRRRKVSEITKEKIAAAHRGKIKPYKRSIEGLINNRENRRKHSNIAKLDIDKVKDIKIMLSNGFTLKSCAEKYNVSKSTIQCIKDKRTWQDV